MREVARKRVARVLSELLFPPVVVAIAILVCALGSDASPWDALRIWGVAALFSCVVPVVFVLWRVRRGKAEDHQVPARADRIVPAVFSVVSVCVGLVILFFLEVPRDVLLLYVSGLALGVLLGIATLRVKVSAHVGVLTGVTVALAAIMSPWYLLGLLLLPAAIWARLELEAHTPFQLALAAGIGGCTPLAIVVLASFL